MDTVNSDPGRRSALPYAVAAACLLALLWSTWVTARDGVSMYLSWRAPENAPGNAQLDRAIQLSPFDSRPFSQRARYLRKNKQVAEAKTNFESAVERRPHDYILWLRLGDTREELNDLEGAVFAYQESIRLAPSYSQPHWYLGLLWLRTGKSDAAFSEMRKAAAVEPHLFRHLMGHAWRVYKGDTEAVNKAVQPKSPEDRFALADFLFQQGKTAEAVAIYQSADGLSQKDRRRLVAALIKSKAFQPAYEMWAQGRAIEVSSGAALSNGGFETDLAAAGAGFDWQFNHIDKVRVARDPREPQSGSYSLRFDFDGNSPSTDLASQLLLVESGARYEITFAARTQDLITGGVPTIAINDASDGRSLGVVKLSGEKTSGWQIYSLGFAAADTTRAIAVSIKREQCTSSPCPAFGHTWFDTFVCRRLK